MTELTDIKNAYEASGNAREAIGAFSALIENKETDDATREQALIERGMLWWRQDERAKAINDYNAALAINPGSKAGGLRRQAYEILDFYNHDLYNP